MSSRLSLQVANMSVSSSLGNTMLQSSGNNTRQQLLTTMADTITTITAHRDSLLAAQSDLDKDVNNIYHMIEYLPLSAVQLSKITKKLKTILQARREHKEEINFWTVILNRNGFENAKLKPNIAGPDHDKDAAKRDAKYTRESITSYEKMFGEPFKKVKKDDQ